MNTTTTAPQITNLAELVEGKEYLMYSAQFDATNIARFICGDTTEMKRELSYWQFSRRGYSPLRNKTQLANNFKNDIYNPTVFVLWDFDLKYYTITEIN